VSKFRRCYSPVPTRRSSELSISASGPKRRLGDVGYSAAVGRRADIDALMRGSVREFTPWLPQVRSPRACDLLQRAFDRLGRRRHGPSSWRSSEPVGVPPMVRWTAVSFQAEYHHVDAAASS
jgi:hypothetical protein